MLIFPLLIPIRVTHAGDGGPGCRGFLCGVRERLVNKLMSPIYDLLSRLSPAFGSPTNPWAGAYGGSARAVASNPVVVFGTGLKTVGVPALETAAGIAADPAGLAVEETLIAAGVDPETAALLSEVPTSPADIAALGWKEAKKIASGTPLSYIPAASFNGGLKRDNCALSPKRYRLEAPK